MRQPKILLVHPGASWSTADVFDGLSYGLRYHGADISVYRLDERIALAVKTLHARWRQQRKHRPDLVKPTHADVVYQASLGVLEMALRQQVDAVLIVSGMFIHPDVILLLKRAGLRVVVLFTESPYDLDAEVTVAAMVDGCWTNERASVPAFQAVNAKAGYLPHAWHPERHYPSPRPTDADVPSHDVVFVGSGFAERIAWFNAIDWTGIDLGLYGQWKGLKRELRPCVRSAMVHNDFASALYRRAKIGLNLYRVYARSRDGSPRLVTGESLSPRAYELAKCGVFHISEDRAEVQEVFGALVPTFRTPHEAAALIRLWLADDAGRRLVASNLPACVAEASWLHRAATVLGDLSQLFAKAA